MYKYTKFIADKTSYADSHKKNGSPSYKPIDYLIKVYSKESGLTLAQVEHIQFACVEHKYIWKPTYGDTMLLHDLKGSKFLDSFWGMPIGLWEESLHEYKGIITFISGVGITTVLFTIDKLIGFVSYLWNHLFV